MDATLQLLLSQGLPSGMLAAYAVLFALAEIEIEGPDGWAARLPTWYRVSPSYARLFAVLSGGKPLTGYHAMMLPLVFASFHLGFAFGLSWSPAIEAGILARLAAWLVVWDAMWFLLNPHFGWRRFSPQGVWWMSRLWIAGVPFEYWSGIALSFGIAALARALGPEVSSLAEHSAYVAWMLAALAAAALVAPLYQAWHRHMRRDGSDERHRSGLAAAAPRIAEDPR